MNNSVTPFQTRSREAARRFLQSVIVIDDQARFELIPKEKVAMQVVEQTQELQAEEEASEFMGIDEVIPEDLVDLSPPDAGEIQVAAQHELNAQQLIGRFAGEGLVCAVLKPEKENLPTILGDTVKAAERADVLIVDWQILEEPQDVGKHALQIIHDILKKDGEANGRIRLIVIYTGERDVYNIAQKIDNDLKSRKIENLILDEESPVLSGNAIRIVVLAKTSSKANPQAKVSIDELPNRILNEFAEMTSGLVTNATLVALSVVREKTPSILKNIHKGLDAPFLTHRALISEPEDAGELLLSLIADELHSTLGQSNVVEEVSMDAIKEWLAANHLQDTYSFLDDKNQPVSVPKDSLLALLSLGKEEALAKSKVVGLSKASINKKLTYIFCRSTEKDYAERYNEEFAMLTTLETRYSSGSSSPILSMGVILSKTEETDVKGQSPRTTYWLCIQPPCDSVRLKGDAVKFPLLPMTEVASNEKFHLFVPTLDKNRMIRLRLSKKLAESDIVKFKPENGCVRSNSKIENGAFVFTSLNGPYLWVAQIKFARAQATMNDLSAELSRVGIDTSEWLRGFNP